MVTEMSMFLLVRSEVDIGHGDRCKGRHGQGVDERSPDRVNSVLLGLCVDTRLRARAERKRRSPARSAKGARPRSPSEVLNLSPDRTAPLVPNEDMHLKPAGRARRRNMTTDMAVPLLYVSRVVRKRGGEQFSR